MAVCNAWMPLYAAEVFGSNTAREFLIALHKVLLAQPEYATMCDVVVFKGTCTRTACIISLSTSLLQVVNTSTYFEVVKHTPKQ